MLPVDVGAGPHGIRTEKLTKAYGKKRALVGVDLRVPEGSTYLLVGQNGAGKTTLLRTLLDIVRPASGSAEVLGMDPAADGPVIRAQIGYVPEGHAWGYGWMRVERLLRHHAIFYPAWDRSYAERLIRFFDLQVDRRVGRLSKGEARRVHLVMALAHRPAILLLDEPTDGLDPVMRDETLGLLADHLAETPTTVLISTHLVHETETLAENIGVLHAGELRAQMPVAELRAGLQRYRAEIPTTWSGLPGLNGAVLRRKQSEREVQLTIWGKEGEILEQLRASGATVREVSRLTLEAAVLALLSRKEEAA